MCGCASMYITTFVCTYSHFSICFCFLVLIMYMVFPLFQLFLLCEVSFIFPIPAFPFFGVPSYSSFPIFLFSLARIHIYIYIYIYPYTLLLYHKAHTCIHMIHQVCAWILLRGVSPFIPTRAIFCFRRLFALLPQVCQHEYNQVA